MAGDATSGIRTLSRPLRRALLSFTVVLLVGFIATPALAVVKESPDDTWHANGPVYAVTRAGNRVYLGGDFTALEDGNGGSVARMRLAALDATTGAPIDWAPSADGIVRTVQPSSTGTKVFVGGQFDHVNDVPRHNLAAIRASDAGLVPGWSPSASSVVYGLEVYGNTVFAGGAFKSIGGQPRAHLAALSAGDGTLKPFDPGADGSPRALSISPDGKVLYVGGNFSEVGGSPRRNAAALKPGSGAVKGWTPNPDYPLLDILATSSAVYVAGAGGGGTLEAFEPLPGDNSLWSVHTDGNVQAVGAVGDTVYGGGHFGAAGGSSRPRIFAVDATTGGLLSWNPVLNGSVGVRSLFGYADKLYVGGDFTQVGGEPREGFAQFTDLGP
jgi:hypothetical protein